MPYGGITLNCAIVQWSLVFPESISTNWGRCNTMLRMLTLGCEWQKDQIAKAFPNTYPASDAGSWVLPRVSASPPGSQVPCVMLRFTPKALRGQEMPIYYIYCRDRWDAALWRSSSAARTVSEMVVGFFFSRWIFLITTRANVGQIKAEWAPRTWVDCVITKMLFFNHAFIVKGAFWH